MRKYLLLILLAAASLYSHAQLERNAGNWKTWFISSVEDYMLKAPLSNKAEINAILSRQKALSGEDSRQIGYWNAGPPGYRWYELISKVWIQDTGYNGALAALLLNTSIYDATIAAWNVKYKYNRQRPYQADNRVQLLITRQESPSYPCEVSVAAGAAVTIIGHFYPYLKDSITRMAERAMNSRINGGVAFPSDVAAGFDLGKKIAEAEIAATSNFVNKEPWNGNIPQGPNMYRGRMALFPMLKNNRTVVLTRADQLRPAPPKDFEREMAELKAYKQNFVSRSNAFYWANSFYWREVLNQKMFEYNIQLNAPRAARMFAAYAVASYDAFVSCWDAKYTYWGIRPDQYDTTYKALIPTPPFPGYPSGHASSAGVSSVLFSYFFPEDKELFEKKAQEAALSRFQAGIHFRSDNEVGLDMGRKVAAMVIERISMDGSEQGSLTSNNKSPAVKKTSKKGP